MIERFGELGIHLPSLIVYGLNFGLLFALLYLVAYKPILKMLDQRSSTIRDSMDQVERIRQEAAQAEERVKARLDEARVEGQQVVNQASQAGERVKEEARAELATLFDDEAEIDRWLAEMPLLAEELQIDIPSQD